MIETDETRALQSTTDTPEIREDELGHICMHIHRWITACDEHHEQCQEKANLGCPDWVVDVKNYCIVPGKVAEHYVALSYVWQNWTGTDGVKGRPVLHERNLAAYQKPDSLKQSPDSPIPRVIDDSIRLVNALGLGYLWVDCFCIVQDAPDVHEKVERMDEIYARATFTIVAAVEFSLFENKRRCDCRDCVISRYDLRPSPLKFISPVEFYEQLQLSRWATRGWCFQEAILSRRVVVFLNGGMFWDCVRCFWTIDGPEKDSELVSMSDHRPEHMRPHHGAGQHHLFQPDFRTWFEFVCIYNQRKFTYSQDALVAFSGILNLLHRGFPEGFVSGLPKEFLAVALAWQPQEMAVRRTCGTEGPSRYIPSWSCFGWQCALDPRSLRSGLASSGNTDSEEIAASWRTQSLLNWSVVKRQFGDRLPILENSTASCLHISTTRAFFKVDVPYWGYEPDIRSGMLQPYLEEPCLMKIPILSIREPNRTSCNILWLSHAGRKVGLLRKMESSSVQEGVNIELIAISSGTATRADLEKAFEEEHDSRTTRWRRQSEKPSPDADTDWMDDEDKEEYLYALSREWADWWDEEYYDAQSDSKDEVIHFYNVMWIERQDDLAFRRAVGRVSKSAWEKYCSGPIEVVLA